MNVQLHIYPFKYARTQSETRVPCTVDFNCTRDRALCSRDGPESVDGSQGAIKGENIMNIVNPPFLSTLTLGGLPQLHFNIRATHRETNYFALLPLTPFIFATIGRPLIPLTRLTFAPTNLRCSSFYSSSSMGAIRSSLVSETTKRSTHHQRAQCSRGRTTRCLL